MKQIFRLLVVVLIGTMTLHSTTAQPLNIGGATMNNDIIGWGDLYELSLSTHNYGTARSMAMGNAFTALGADMVSTSLNPAGVGMYINSDVSITPLLQFSRSKTEGADSFPSSEFSDKSTRFGISSFGAIFAAYRGTKALTNLNVGIAYNRIADFNRSTTFASYDNTKDNSMANLFKEFSNADGLLPNADGKMPFGNDPYYWGAVLAYKNGLTNYNGNQGWIIDRIGNNAIVDQYTAIETRGSIGEYALSVGFNFIDKLYIGATLGIQSVSYRRNTFYGENYLYPIDDMPDGNTMPYQLEYMNYQQITQISGTGVNFKLGITWRPVHWLRIGAAFHTPTAYNLTLQYYGDMWSKTFSAGSNPDGYKLNNDGTFDDYVESPSWEDSGEYAWRVSSPSRLMVGAAVTIAKRVIISADYEASFYNKTRLRGSPIQGLDYTGVMNNFFKTSNTIRLGAEFRVLPALDLRAGYIWSGSSLKRPNDIYTHPITKQQSYITAGAGVRLSDMVYLDLAYQYNHNKSTAYQSFFATNDSIQIESVPVTTSTARHIAVLTLGFRF